MTRRFWRKDRDSGEWVEVTEVKTSPVESHSVLTDEIPGGMLSHADSKVYTSKSKYRESLRRLGKIEVGNETNWEPKPDPGVERRKEEKLRDDVERSYQQVRNNTAPLTEYDRYRCEIMNRQIRNR